MTRHVLFTAVRNEGPFLLEWVAYHLAIGFDQILVVSNDCDDGTDDLLQALQAQGAVRHIAHQVPADASPQGRAAALANASGVIRDGDWVIWLDADEFLNIHAGRGRVDDLIAALDGAEGMLIPWRVFGDGGNARFPGRFISKDFTGAAAVDHAPNATIKTFYRHRDGATRFGETANHRPRLIDRTRYRAQDFLTAAGRPIEAGFGIHDRWLAGVEGKANFNIAPGEMSWDLAQINHYMVRTREAYALKKRRGRGFRAIKDGKARIVDRHTDEFYDRNNRNEEADLSILRHAAATGRIMARLLKDPATAQAQAATQALTAQRQVALAEDAGSQTMSATVVPPAASPVPPPVALATEPADGPALAVPVITLPRRERALVAERYAQADTVLEYGSGGSTLLAAQAGCGLVMSVESDRGWAANLSAVIARDFPGRALHIHHEDIGATKAWGRPRNDAGWRGWHRYALSVWDQPWFRQPEVVLIDGRFRVACFLATLLRTEAPVTVLFDDYTPRPAYAFVERYAAPAQIAGRMARFELKPTALPRRDLTAIVAWFNDPE